jgi:hypothetical protein
MPPMPMGDCWWGGELGLPIGQERSKTFISPAPFMFVVSLSSPVVSSHCLFQLLISLSFQQLTNWSTNTISRA